MCLAMVTHLSLLLIVPSIPTAFNIIMVYHGNMETTVTLDWDPPQGSGPEAIVDNYTISISPTLPYKSANILVFLQELNITLAHNFLYSINLTAVNCAGESKSVTLSNIGYGK